MVQFTVVIFFAMLFIYFSHPVQREKLSKKSLTIYLAFFLIGRGGVSGGVTEKGLITEVHTLRYIMYFCCICMYMHFSMALEAIFFHYI